MQARSGEDVGLMAQLAGALGRAVLLVDGDGAVRYASDEVARVFGADRQRLADLRAIPTDWADLVDATGSPLPLDRGPMARTLRDGERIDGERIGLRRADRTIWLTVTSIPVEDPARPGGRLALLVFDAVRHELGDERKPLDLQTVLSSAFDASPMAMVVARLDGRVVHCNGAYRRLLPGRMTTDPSPWWSFLDRADRAELVRRLAELAGEHDEHDDRAALQVECRGRVGRDGAPVIVQITAAAVRQNAGLLSIQISDVTDLRQSELRYRSLAETIPVGIFEMDRRGRFTYVNPGMAAVTRCEDDLVGRYALEFIHPDDHERSTERFADALAGREWSMEQRVIAVTGEERRVLTVGRPICDAGGAVVGVLGNLVDFTEHLLLQDRLRELDARYETLAAQQARERLEAELAQAQRFETMGRLAGGVAHDFNNLLGVISNYAGFLAKRPDLPVALRHDVDQIAEAARRGAELTRQLLLFSRREQLRPHRFDLGRALTELGALMTRPLQPSVSLHIEAAEQVYVEADQGQIEQMLLNLLINARDALPDGGRITLRATTVAASDRRGGTDALVEVTDDGTGMAPDVAARAFEPFFTTKPRSEASGLGLATVQGIVEQAGGTVSITTALGEGTTVRIRLPAC